MTWLRRRPSMIDTRHDTIELPALDGGRPERAPTGSNGHPLLVCEGVQVAYDKVKVLFGVDLTLQQGEIVALLGTNGAGKSTLLKAISGLVDPAGGRITFEGRDITHADAVTAAKLGIVQVPGGKAVFPTLTVAEHFKAAAWLYAKEPPAEIAARTEEVLGMFPRLRERWDQMAGNLSGGEQQQLGLGMAFVAKPRLLVIDELSLGLAPTIVEQLLGIVRRIHATGCSIIIVEQSVNVALTLADRGKVTLRGADISGWGPDRRAAIGLGRSFQDARIFPSLTVAENVAIGLERHIDTRDHLAALLNLPAVQESERDVAYTVDDLIELMNLQAFRDKFVSELSTGSRRIVDLAMAIAHDPTVLILDEPSSGIAQRETEALGPLLLRIKEETGCSMLVIEHDMPLITSISDRMIALELGAVVTEGTPDEVISDPRVVESYLGGDVNVIHRSGTVESDNQKTPSTRKAPATKAAAGARANGAGPAGEGAKATGAKRASARKSSAAKKAATGSPPGSSPARAKPARGRTGSR